MAVDHGPLVREPDSGQRRQLWGTVVETGLRLDHDVTATLVDALSIDHAGSFNLFYLLRKHYWTAEGAEHGEVATFLGTAYRRMRLVTDDIADRIVELGGIPPNTPPTIQARAEVHLEAEDRYDLRASLEGDLVAYTTLIGTLREHIRLAHALGDPGTAERLHRHLDTLERDVTDLDDLLGEDTLVQTVGTPSDQSRARDATETPTTRKHKPHLRKLDATYLRQEWDTVAENRLRLDDAVAGELCTALNSDLSGLYILFNQLRKHYWTIEGAEQRQITAFLVEAADRLAVITDTIAIRVHALGGVPVCGPMGVRQHAPMPIEAAHRYDARSSFERDLDGYATLAAQFREHIELTSRLGDEATSELLRGHSKTLEEDLQVLQRSLADDTLV